MMYPMDTSHPWLVWMIDTLCFSPSIYIVNKYIKLEV